MTEQQLEQAARELCRLRGIDPDGPDPVCLQWFAVGDHPNPDKTWTIESKPLPLWKRFVPEVVAWDQVRRAVESVVPPADPVRRP